MKKSIIALTALIVLTSTAQADYILKIPMVQGQGGAGGSLPNGSINFITRTPPLPIENWKPADAIYSNWTNKDVIYDCNWTPATSTVLKDDPLDQTATYCKQDQFRTKQEREQETTTLAYRDIGIPVSEIKTNNITAYGEYQRRSTMGTADCVFLNSSYKMSYWFAGYNNAYLVYVGGAMIASGNSYGMSTVYGSGKIYKRGTTVKGRNNGYPMYDVCR